MDPLVEQQLIINRRHFFGRASYGIGGIALASLLNSNLFASSPERQAPTGGLRGLPHFAPKAKRVIYLFQSGGPSQLDLYDYKPVLKDQFAKEVPTSVYPAERKTTMTSGQSEFLAAPTIFKFERHGQSGTYFSELLPHTAGVADDLCLVKSMYTEAINHDPAITFFQTGSQIAGRPSMGAWVSYGLGSDNRDLPAFVAMSSHTGGQPLYDRLSGAGFLPGRFQGVKFRSTGNPILDIMDPAGVDRKTRRTMLDFVSKLNQLKRDEVGDPEIDNRIAQYELAYRMQTSVPELTDVSHESNQTFELYGDEARKPGNYAYNCLLARRLAERGVRFIQLYHRGWDHHGDLPKRLRAHCEMTDRGSAALVRDLKQRGMLDETLIIWGGEFGRTIYSQGKLTETDYGRDHHPACFTMWMAGGGIKPGISYGETDDYSVNVTENGVHVHDLQATILHQLGIHHERLTYKYQGRHFRLTDVHGDVVNDILA